MNEKQTICLRYWPKNKPIPDGWVLANDMAGTHHGLYSVLIKQIIDTKKENQNVQS